MNFYVGLAQERRRRDARRSSASAGAVRRSARRRRRSSSRATGSRPSWATPSRTSSSRQQHDGRGQVGRQPRASPSRTRWPTTRRTSRPPGSCSATSSARPGMQTWTSQGLALPSRSDVKPAEGRQPRSSTAAPLRPPVAVRPGVLEGDGHREQRAHGRAGGQADRPRHAQEDRSTTANDALRPFARVLLPRAFAVRGRRRSSHDT